MNVCSECGELRTHDRLKVEDFRAERMIAWIKAWPKKDAILGFTAGNERNIAYAIEDRFREFMAKGDAEVDALRKVAAAAKSLILMCDGPSYPCSCDSHKEMRDALAELDMLRSSHG